MFPPASKKLLACELASKVKSQILHSSSQYWRKDWGNYRDMGFWECEDEGFVAQRRRFDKELAGISSKQQMYFTSVYIGLESLKGMGKTEIKAKKKGRDERKGGREKRQKRFLKHCDFRKMALGNFFSI